MPIQVLDPNHVKDFTGLTLADTMIQFVQSPHFDEPETLGIFTSSQFGVGKIELNSTVVGDVGSDNLLINMDTNVLDLRNLVFSNWSANAYPLDTVRINGSAGDDTIYGASVRTSINGGDGDDLIFVNQGDYNVYGQNGDDTITVNGTPNSAGLAGENIGGGVGFDTLIINAQTSVINQSFISSQYSGPFVGFEVFQLTTGSGNDDISGGAFDDIITTNAGNDIISGNDGDDQLNGGSGRDTIAGGSGDDAINGGTEGDSISGGIGIDTILGGGGNDMIDGEDGDDVIDGGSGFDIIDGGIGNDTLKGGSYGDWIDGGAGNDVITGGAGRDLLGGGGGVDKFQYNSLSERGDIIEDFNSNDFMVFDASNFGLGSYVGTATATQFVAKTSGHAASTTTQRFIYDKTDDSLWYDSNGSATGGTIVKIADFNTTYDLNAGDILFIA